MKVYIFADIEGVSGITGDAFVNGPFADEGRRLMTADVNACVAACFENGASAVTVRDGHGSGVNLRPGDLDPRAALVQGATGSVRFFGLDGCDTMILLGYHAMAGTPGAILEHTYSSRTIQRMWYNGRPVGEAGIDALIAGEHGVPVVMISGDDKLCAEAAVWLPQAVACVVKTGCGWNSGLALPAEESRRRIAVSVREALHRAGSVRPLLPEYPAALRWEVVERCQLPAEAPGVQIIDGHTFEKTGGNLEKLLLG